MKYSQLYHIIALPVAVLLLSCEPSVDLGNETPKDEPELPSDTDDHDNGDNAETPDTPQTPKPDTSIEQWSGKWADDCALDSVGDDIDFFHELNSFTTRVEVLYNGDNAAVSCANNNVTAHIDGAYITLDLTKVSGVEVVVSGTTANGALKIYSDNKYKLLLNGTQITSQRGPAINSQSKKRMYVHLADGTTNILTDCAIYGDDCYTMPGVYNEDRKGAFFAEGNIIMSGYGALVVAGRYKHAIVTDGCYYQRPGTTVVITEAAKNGIHAKGDSDDGTGIVIAGGYISATIASTAGKGIKCDMDIIVNGGTIDCTTSGDATYDSESQDTSAAAAIKSNGNIHITDGVLNLSSSGSGGKGISGDAALIIDGGTIDISTTGGQYKYSSQLTSSPKGIRADGDITINGGRTNISVTGRSEGSEGMESKGTLCIEGGEVIINSYDDAINAAVAIQMNGGRVYAHATNNDGIDTNGSLTINGGLMIGIGTTDPEGGIDVDNSTSFKINGGTAIGIGGTMMGKPSTASTQNSVVYAGVTSVVGKKIALLDTSDNALITIEIPIQMNNSTLFFSSPDIHIGESYAISEDGTLDNYTDSWQGWYDGGVWSSGTTLTTFTPSTVVTQIGNTSGPGGGPGGPGGGGGRPHFIN